MSEPTKEEMLFWLEYWVNQSIKDGKDYQETKAYKVIRHLIENMDKKSKVTKEQIQKWRDGFPYMKGKSPVIEVFEDGKAYQFYRLDEYLKGIFAELNIEIEEGGKGE